MKDKSTQWEGVEERILKLIFSMAETQLKESLRVALAADKRAVLTGGVFLLSAILLSAIGFGVLAAFPVWFAMAFWGCSFSLCTGARFCFSSAKPIAWYCAGNQPKSWGGFLERGDSFNTALGEEIENYQKYITANRKALQDAASKFKKGLRHAAMAPAVGVLWGLVNFMVQLWREA